MTITSRALSRVIPPNSFLGSYLTLQESLETPFWYDFWCGMWAISIAAGREYIVPRPRIPVHTNLYIIILAESGVTRKSTAISNIHKVASDAGLLSSTRVLQISGPTSAAKLEVDLYTRFMAKQDCWFAIIASELVRVLDTGISARSLPGLLVDLYDCPKHRIASGNVARGTVEHRNIYASMIAACAPSWLSSSIHRDVLRGGFTSRLLYVIADERKRKVAWPSESDMLSRDQCVEKLQDVERLADITGSCAMHPASLRVYEAWYNRLKPPSDEYRRSFQSRQDDHVLKVAALLALNTGTCVVTKEIMHTSIRLINEVCETGAGVFSPNTNATPTLIRGVERVRGELLKKGGEGILQKDLYLKCRNYIDALEFRALLTVMQELKLVDSFEIQTVGRGRKPRLWRMRDALLGTSVSEILIKMEHE